jgi:hypothetical protein
LVLLTTNYKEFKAAQGQKINDKIQKRTPQNQVKAESNSSTQSKIPKTPIELHSDHMDKTYGARRNDNLDIIPATLTMSNDQKNSASQP